MLIRKCTASPQAEICSQKDTSPRTVSLHNMIAMVPAQQQFGMVLALQVAVNQV